MKTSIKLAGWLFGASLAGLLHPAQAATDMFLKIDGIEGESLDEVHAKEIDVDAWSWGMAKPSGSRVSISDLTFTKRVDKASPPLMKACAAGDRHGRATLTLRRPGRNAVEYSRVVLEDVMISGVQGGSSTGEEIPTEQVSLAFARVGIEYFTILPNGTAGERGEFAWNRVEDRAGGVTFPGGAPNPDADNDGMPDAWEAQFGLNTALNDANLDRDNDGATNREEFLAGTSPTDPNKVFRSNLTFVPGSPTATLRWNSAAGKSYRVLMADALGGTFQTVATVSSAGETTTTSVPAASVNRFFRVEVLP